MLLGLSGREGKWKVKAALRGTALAAGSFQPRQGGQDNKGNIPWCDYHNSSSHCNAQCYNQGANRPPQKAKANAAKANSILTPTASAAVASYDSDGSASNAFIHNANQNDFVIDSGPLLSWRIFALFPPSNISGLVKALPFLAVWQVLSNWAQFDPKTSFLYPVLLAISSQSDPHPRGTAGSLPLTQ